MFGLFIGTLFRLLWLFWSVNAVWDSGLKEKYDGYGEDWIFMPDGKGQPQVAVIKVSDPEGRVVLDEAIGFILYTRSNSEEGIQLRINDSNALQASYFSPSKPTKFITHGWKSNAFSESVLKMKQGHSLGAHVAGNTGEHVSSGKLGRVTGLDPALPGFHLLSLDKGRLDSTDALFVDVIHSCGGVLGYMKPLGHVDFYPNAGVAVQPGCCCVPELIEACSHGRAYKYFSESINSIIGFRAKQCENWDKYLKGECDNLQTAFLGEHVDKSARGSYFLKTRSEPPFAYNNEIDDNNV